MGVGVAEGVGVGAETFTFGGGLVAMKGRYSHPAIAANINAKTAESLQSVWTSQAVVRPRVKGRVARKLFGRQGRTRTVVPAPLWGLTSIVP